eukprot:5113125-Pyramimonas_sp.AAC.1
MLVIGRLLPKKVSGDRVIGLISMLSRVWSMSREPWVRSWSSRSEPHWDAAVRSNSSLGEAFRRVLDEETAG